MAKRQTNVKYLNNYIKYCKTTEQKDLIQQVITLYESGKIHKHITADNMIKKIMNTKTSRQSVVKQLPTLETKQPVNKIVYKSVNKLEQFITIQEQTCVLDNITCVEYPNVEVLDKLLHSDLLNTVKYNKDEFGKVYENERKHLEAYKMKVDKDGHVKVTYNKYNSMKYGRVYCKDSLGAITIRKEIRGTLFDDKYVDLDMCNCHPNIYYQIAKLYKMDCPNLESYVLHRDTVLNTIMTYYNVDRYTAKNLFIRLLYLGGFKKWQTDNNIKKDELPFITKLRKELSLIADNILINNVLLVQRVKENIKKDKMTKHQIKCCVVSYFNQEIECRILEQIYLYCVSNGIINNNECCLCYDGIMILKEHYNENLLNEFSKLIDNKFGLHVKFEQKEMTNYLDIIDDHVKPQRQTMNINQRYLLDKDRLLNDSNEFVNNVKLFLEDKQVKSLNIKSPYDTGKTQLIKSILRDYPTFTRVLMVTYRITLAYEFEAVLSEFNFVNYKNGDFKGDHLINQTESLLRLTDDCNTLPKYDLIIIDESESVLNQFKSPTFKGKSAPSFELLVALCKNPSTKIITLDGDMADRTHTFVDYFGKSININNTCKFINKTLHILHGNKALEDFETKIMNDLSNKLKLVIPAMSATYALELKAKIENQHQNCKVLVYTSSTSDNEKQDIKNIVPLWSSADVVIYTPTIEAGVSFDVEGHFDRLYGYVCSNSCSQRSFFQMMSRVRKFNKSDFYIYSEFPCDTVGNTWTYEEIDNKSLYPKDLILQNEYEYNSITDETYIVRKNELYRQIYIHNLVEEKNKHSKVFMGLFFETASKKGYAIELHELNEKENNDDVDEDVKDKKQLQKYLEILEAENIDQSTYEEYMKYQRNGKATKKQKLAIQKHVIKCVLCLDNLDYDNEESKVEAYNIVKKYVNNSSLKNLTALIDENNINDKDELTSRDRKQIVSYVKLIINKLGFDHCCDKKQIDINDFVNNCKSTCVLLSELSKDTVFNQLCNISKDDLSYLQNKDLTAQMRRINVILNKCCIKVSNIDKSKKKGAGVYTLNIIDNMDEVLSNKIRYQNMKLHDTSNIFKLVELNYFKRYITREPKQVYDTSGIDEFID